MQQTEKYWRLITRTAVIGVFMMMGVGAVLIFTPTIRETKARQKKLDRLEAQTKQEKEAVEKNASNSRRFNTDPEFVERIAHEVGYVSPDETVYIFPSEENED
ncbi:MAG: septum formation initiator family protein [Pontiellaceae bacterium]|nr:septum formation initiator family protein [Pontiellaceae bacterium]